MLLSLIASAAIGCSAHRLEPNDTVTTSAVLGEHLDDQEEGSGRLSLLESRPGTRDGAHRAPATPRSSTVAIAATGDLLLTRRAVKVWRGMGPDGIDRMLAGYRGVLRDDDIATLNLETPLVNDVNRTHPGSPPLPPILGAPPETVHALSRAGVDLVSVANNHVFDQGFSGLERTIGLLDGVGIGHAGVGQTRDDSFNATVMQRGELRVAFLSMTGLVNGRSQRRGSRRHFVAVLFDEARVLEAIRAAQADADLVVVCVHWSTDFAPRVTEWQRRLARRMVEAGADLIVGTGPHVLQEVERLTSDRGDAVVAYSLGNLLSAMALRYRAGGPVNPRSEPARVRPEGRDGVVLRVRFEVSTSSSASTPPTIRLASLEGIPLWTHNTYWEHRLLGEPFEIRVVPLSEAPDEISRERRSRIEEALGDEVELLE